MFSDMAVAIILLHVQEIVRSLIFILVIYGTAEILLESIEKF